MAHCTLYYAKNVNTPYESARVRTHTHTHTSNFGPGEAAIENHHGKAKQVAVVAVIHT
jgi:hypothetical protein